MARKGGGWGGWDPYPKTNRRRANADGVAAKRKSGAIGETWWSKRFVSVLERVTNPTRLKRGKTYARSGQVSHLTVETGVVTARVQGSRPLPYRVHITFAAFTEAQWARAEAALASQALFAAALLAGEMPHEIEAVMAEAGVSLFPMYSGDLQTRCTCPDYENPCKHVAATYYMLAEHFDADPFAILAWRGRDRETLVAGLRERRAAGVEVDPAPAPPAEPEPADLGSFWAASPEALALQFRPDEDVPADALLRQLGPIGGPTGPLDQVVEAVRTLASAARERAAA